MQYSILFAILVAVTVASPLETPGPPKQEESAHKKECLAEFKLDEKVLQDAEEGTFADDPNLKGFTFCFAKRAGYLNEKGEFQVDAIRRKLAAKHAAEEDVDGLIKQCLVQKDTPELSAFEAMVCFKKNEHKTESA